jgi:flavin reductase (DIM6/NTAB) family NADH-FMN oxidoreductase RutF
LTLLDTSWGWVFAESEGGSGMLGAFALRLGCGWTTLGKTPALAAHPRAFRAPSSSGRSRPAAAARSSFRRPSVIGSSSRQQDRRSHDQPVGLSSAAGPLSLRDMRAPALRREDSTARRHEHPTPRGALMNHLAAGLGPSPSVSGVIDEHSLRSELPPNLWKDLTSTVGLVVSLSKGAVNVMSAEWSYFVAKAPPCVADILKEGRCTKASLIPQDAFCVTFCSEEQADLADFFGSFTAFEVSKTNTRSVELSTPVGGVPWVRGGVLAVECVIRQRVPLPGYVMFVGQVFAAHRPNPRMRPLVKHGQMFTLGDPAPRRRVVASAQLDSERRVLRVVATAASDEDEPYGISLSHAGVETKEWGKK